MSTPVGIIKKFVKTLTETTKTGTAAANEAFKAVGAESYYALHSELRNLHRGEYWNKNKNLLEQVCGVRINNTDTGAITGSDAGGKTTKTAESIVPETATAKELTSAQYNSFTKNGLKVNVTYQKLSDDDLEECGLDRLFNYSSATYLAKQKLVTRALYNWWIPEALDLINQSLGVNFTDGRASINTIDVRFTSPSYDDEDYGDYAVALDFSYDLGLPTKATLWINADELYKITASDKNGTLNSKQCIYSGFYCEDGDDDEPDRYDDDYYGYGDRSAYFTNYLDRLILQAMAEVTLKANIAYAYYLPQEIKCGLCAIVGGYDDASTNYYDFIGDDYDSNDITGYTLFRYLAKNYSNGFPDGLEYNNAKTVLTVTDDFEDGTLKLANYDSTFATVNAAARKTAIKIVGNALNNSIISGRGNDSLNGDKGADTLWGGTGNDTLTGGAGNDLFIYSAGKDVITDYASGDKISLGADITKATLSGSDVVLTTSEGTLNIKNAKGKRLSLIKPTGKNLTTIVGGTIFNNSSDAKVTLGTGIEVADASTRTTAIQITGNKLANVILGGSADDVLYGKDGDDSLNGGKGNDKLYGGNSADTLAGGAGNDSLWGNDGNDLFVYSAGNDVIADYAEDDKISLGAAVSKATVSGSDVVLTVGSNTLRIKNAKGKALSLITSAGKELSTIISGMIIDNTTDAKITLGTGIEFANASARTNAITITGNTLANSILGGKGNDKILGSGGADTLAGGDGNDTLWGQSGNDLFVYSAGKDVITDYATGDKISLGAAISKATVSGENAVLTLDTGTLTIKNGRDKTLSLITAEGTSLSTVISGENALTLTDDDDAKAAIPSDLKLADASARTKDVTIIGNKLNNTLLGGSGNDLLSGGNGTDSLFGDAGDDKLWGGAGADTLEGGKGNDTLSGGAGNDLFIYGSGNDVITDYAAGDKISISASISKVMASDNDAVLTIGSNTLTVKNAKGKTLSLIDSAGNSFSTVVSGNLILDDSSAASVTIPATFESADASARTLAIRITGNALDNTILGGSANDVFFGKDGNDYLSGGKGSDNIYGGDGDDTLIGGAGNDSLWGNDGADTFVYNSGDGKDTISGFDDIDMLEISGTFTATYDSASKAVAFKVGDIANAITLKNFTASVFNVNGDNYTISGTKLVKK